MWSRWFWRLSRWMFGALLAVVFVYGAIVLRPYTEMDDVGCHWFGFEYFFHCEGFVGADAAALTLNWIFLATVSLPWVFVEAISTGYEQAMQSPEFLYLGLVIWGFIFVALMTPLRWGLRMILGRSD